MLQLAKSQRIHLADVQPQLLACALQQYKSSELQSRGLTTPDITAPYAEPSDACLQPSRNLGLDLTR